MYLKEIYVRGESYFSGRLENLKITYADKMSCKKLGVGVLSFFSIL